MKINIFDSINHLNIVTFDKTEYWEGSWQAELLATLAPLFNPTSISNWTRGSNTWEATIKLVEVSQPAVLKAMEVLNSLWTAYYNAGAHRVSLTFKLDVSLSSFSAVRQEDPAPTLYHLDSWVSPVSELHYEWVSSDPTLTIELGYIPQGGSPSKATLLSGGKYNGEITLLVGEAPVE